MRKKIAFLAIIALCISLLSTLAPLMAHQMGAIESGYGFSIIGNIIKWITTSVEDFECGSRRNVSIFPPGDVMLDKQKAWEWWNESWKYRMLFIITNNGSFLEDYQIMIKLTPETFDYSKANRNGSDIRFLDENGRLLPYWIEKWGNVSRIWVRLDIPHGNTSIYMYYGNKNASPYSNGSATFIFFDDFETYKPWNESGMWHTTSRKNFSGRHSKWYGNESTGNYDNGSRNHGNLTSMQFNGSSSCLLELWMWRDVESYPGQYDITAIYDSSDATTWNRIWYNDSSNPSSREWKFLSIKMDPDASYIRFYFDTVDAINNGYGGWYIDDVRVRKIASPLPSVNPAMEQSLNTWMDYFGGTGAIKKLFNTSVGKGAVYLKYGILHSKIFNFTGVSYPSNSSIARYDVDDAVLEPVSQFNSTGEEFSTALYDAIARDDNYVAYSIALNGNISQHIFKFAIDIPEERIQGINITWKGYSQYLFRFLWIEFWVGFTTYDGLRIWNFSSSRWDSIGDTPSSNAAVWHVVKPWDYIKNGSMYVMAYAYLDGRTVRILTDYVEINITYASYVNNGSVDSILIKPSNASWEKFYARCSIPDGTNILFAILNESGSLLCTMNGSNAYGYNISFIAEDAIQIHAELNTSNDSISPLIYEWNVTFSSPYYRYGWLESCIHDCGNNATYDEITWNATLANGSDIKFQIASSEDGINWTSFVGPDGSNASYYTKPSKIWEGHNGARYIKFRAYFHGNGYATPVLHDVTITYYGG